MAHGILCQDGQVLDADIDNKPERDMPTSNPGRQVSDSESLQSINDIWQWRSEDEQFPISNFAPQGILGLSVADNGKLSGHAYSQIHFKPDFKQAESMLVIKSRDGEAAVQTNGNFKLNFTAKDDLGNVITTDAVFIPSAMEIHGTSVAAVKYEGKPVTIKYSWGLRSWGEEEVGDRKGLESAAMCSRESRPCELSN